MGGWGGGGVEGWRGGRLGGGRGCGGWGHVRFVGVMGGHFRQVGVVRNDSDSPKTQFQSGFQTGTSPDPNLSRAQA